MAHVISLLLKVSHTSNVLFGLRAFMTESRLRACARVGVGARVEPSTSPPCPAVDKLCESNPPSPPQEVPQWQPNSSQASGILRLSLNKR